MACQFAVFCDSGHSTNRLPLFAPLFLEALLSPQHQIAPTWVYTIISSIA